ncbi:hypothetical protein [Sphingobacterium faecium]|uniref:hypothetical protein n=1 Tax=Sphingobacterium faecium TaxID=34087 RepID=UPI00247AF0C1|nr:hypothetical protein [Sphingobacterium faecium]WGQ15594.1 hypothetical protein QG727_04110 [Sphingobacterium faecium]
MKASEAKEQTPELTIEEILKELDKSSKRGESIYLIHPTRFVSPMVIAELMRLEYKCYEFKDQVIGLNGLAIEWR